MTARTVVYRRELLYEQVWNEPATKVAQRYSISSVALGKICRDLHVPAPGRGYWAKHAVGNAPERPALPPMPHQANERRVTRRTYLLDRERTTDSHACGKIAAGAPLVVPHMLVRPHPLIAAAVTALDGARLRNGLVHAPSSCLDVVVSPNARARALRVMNTLILALEERGLAVEVTDVEQKRPVKYDEAAGSTRVLVAGEWVRFQVVEALVQVEPPMTKQPPKNLKGPELEQWGYWNRPRIQLVPSGKLVLRMRERAGVRTSWRDGQRPIEERLNAFIQQLFVVADAKKQEREAQTQWRAGFEAQQQRAERKRANASRRARRVAFVTEQLQQWRDARDLRELVAATRAQLDAVPEPRWLTWAAAYADEIDPVRALRTKSSTRNRRHFIGGESGRVSAEIQAETRERQPR